MNELIKHSKKIKKNPPGLYHISFNSELEGIWTPKEPDGDYTEVTDKSLLPEVTAPRISMSPTIQQCFQAVYANVKHLFTKKENKLTFNVYSPVFKGDELIVTPDILAKEKLVHDAHVTEEHAILTPVYMKHVGTVTIDRPDTKNNIDYYAYNIKTKDGFYGWVPGKIRISFVSTERLFGW